MFTKQSIVETITALLVFLFLYTGLSKYIEASIFRNALLQSPILKNITDFVSLSLPGIEIALALLLIFPRSRLLALYCSAGLLFIFTAYLTYMIATTPNLPCNCGGVISLLSWKQHIVFNICIFSMSVVGIQLQKKMQRGLKMERSEAILSDLV